MAATSSLSILSRYKDDVELRRDEPMSFEAWLDFCKNDKGGAGGWAPASARLLSAIGKPQFIDTAKDERLGRIFLNANIRTFPEAFGEFYGMEDQINRIVSFLEQAKQGLEESKQILYLLGPVGSAKSSLAERLKTLMQKEPIYVLKAGDQYSPIFESPLNLFDPTSALAEELEGEYGIPRRMMPGIMSPWAQKRLDEFGGDISKFEIVRIYPSKGRQIAIAKTEPGDENNQDISALVGKVDIRKLDRFEQKDPDAYSYSGALNRANQGILEFVEMFKAPIKMLHPLLTSTQEQNYVGTENIGAIPFNGIILAHSNETEWSTFKNNPHNEAFIDRINTIKIPYCLRATEEMKIYEKLIRKSELKDAPQAPGTLQMLANFSVLSRLSEHENSTGYTKMRVYDGENLRETGSKVKSMTEYRDAAGPDEGMSGSSTRWAFKALSATYNYEATKEDGEIAADPVHLLYVLEQAVRREQLPAEVEAQRIKIIKEELAPRYGEFLTKEIQQAYLESYKEFGQNIFDRYIRYADNWIEDQDYKDEDTGQMYNRGELNKWMEKYEKPAGISNPKDFRNEVVKFAMRHQANHGGKNPPWQSYEKISKVIQKSMITNVEEMLPVISFGAKSDSETHKRHNDFVGRMTAHGYTEAQVRRIVEWWGRLKSNGPG